MSNKLTLFQYPKSLLEILLSFFGQIRWFSVFPEFHYFRSLLCIYIIILPCLLPLPQLPNSFLFFSLCCMKPSYAWHVESTKFSSVMIRLIRLIYDLRMLIWGQRGIIWSLKVLIWGMKGWFKSWWLMYISRGLIGSLKGIIQGFSWLYSDRRPESADLNLRRLICNLRVLIWGLSG